MYQASQARLGLCLAALLVCFSFCAAEFSLVSIYNNTADDTAVAVGTTMGACAKVQGITLVTSGSSPCLHQAAFNGTFTSAAVCPSGVGTPSSMFCLSTGLVCFLTNTQDKTIVVVNATDKLSVLQTYGSSYFTLVNPTFITGVTSAAGADVFFTDYNGVNVTIYRMRWLSDMSVIASTVVQIPSAQPAAGLFVNSSLVSVAILQETTVRSFAYNGASKTFTDIVFGPIQTLSGDSAGFMYVYDSSCSCVKKISNGGIQVYNFSLPNPPSYMTHSREGHFIVDATGVWRVTNELVIVSYSYNNITCQYANATINVAGGVGPYTYAISPRFTTNANSTGTTMTFSNIKVFTPYMDVYLYRNGILKSQFLQQSSMSTENVTSTDVPSHSGSLYTFSFKLAPGGSFNYYCASCMNGMYFYALEFWINPGPGDQTISLEVYAVELIRLVIRPGDLVPNTWNRFYYDLQRLPIVAQARLRIRELTNSPMLASNNTMYIDDIKLLAYKSTYPTLMVTDQCGSFQATPPLPITSQAMVVTVNTPTTTCSAGSIDGSLASDAALVANVSGGVPPYKYSWSYGTSTTNVSADLPKIRNNIVVYDNAVNESWVDISPTASGIEKDSTYFRSPPYSYSFASGSYYDGIYINFRKGFVASDYSSFEFWIYGGPIGGQYLGAVVENGLQDLGSFSTLSYLMDVPYLPPDRWVKVVLPIVGTGTLTSKLFTGLIVMGMSDIPQQRVWIDDIMLISKNNVTVTDSTGCSISNYYLEVKSPELIKHKRRITPIKCYGGSDGGVSFNVSGGTAPYSYEWSLNGVTSNGITGQAQSVVSTIITDANGCHAPNTIVTPIDQPPPLEIVSRVDQAVCYGGTGTITATTLGGSGPYSYHWQSSTNSLFNITSQPNPFPVFMDSFMNSFTLAGSPNATVACASVGAYTSLQGDVHFTHAGNCSLAAMPNSTTDTLLVLGCPSCIDLTLFAGIEIWIATDSAALKHLSVSLMHENTSLSTLQLSTLNLSFTGAPKWQKVEFNFNAAGYSVADSVVLQSSSPTPVVLVDDVALLPLASASDTLSTGINVNVGFRSIIAATAGKYSLTVYDKNSCPATTTFSVVQPEKMVVSPTLTVDGTGTITVSGGAAPFSYLWVELNVTTKDVPNLLPGLYTIQVTDAFGCNSIATLYIQSNSIRTLRKFSPALSGGLGALVGVGFVIALFSAFMLARYWTLFSVLGSFFCCVLLAGVVISYVAVLTLLPRPTDALCTAFPWLLGVAFMLVYGCLFIKTWALYQVWSKAKQYQKTSLTPFYIIRILGAVLLLEIIFLIVWTIVDPPRVHHVKVVSNQYELQCNTNHPTFWIIFLSTKGVWLVFGAVLTILTRDVAKKYNESTSISYAIYNIIILCAIGVPLAILLEEVPGGRLVIQVVITTLAFTFTMCIMFFKAWYSALMNAEVVIPPPGRTSATHSRASNHTNSRGETASRDTSTLGVMMHTNSSPTMSRARGDAPNEVVCI